MVMTIPYINKIKILHRISPPLAPPGPTSPVQETRGAMIAIEGYDRDLLAEVGRFVEETIRGDPLYSVRTWETLPSPSSTKPQKQADVETTEPRHSLRDKCKGKCKGISPSDEKTQSQTEKEMEADPFVEYLSIIKTMHRHSKDIVKHITTFPPSASQQQQQKQVPIALLPSGFSLTTSDTFALKIPINDSYAPIDHWQWMATLWRGIIGPDLTVYIVRVGREEMGKFGGVEVRGDVGGIVVRVLMEEEEGVESGFGGAGMDEKTRRRLGFEVLEFVRGGEVGWARAGT